MLWGVMEGETEETRREETREGGREGGRGVVHVMRERGRRRWSAAPIREIRDGNFIY